MAWEKLSRQLKEARGDGSLEFVDNIAWLSFGSRRKWRDYAERRDAALRRLVAKMKPSLKTEEARELYIYWPCDELRRPVLLLGRKSSLWNRFCPPVYCWRR